jgi:uncharacterized phosphosugar-binding protein
MAIIEEEKNVCRRLVMIKMFTTQLTGLFKKIMEKEEFSLEDAARLLAQAPAGDGSIYIYGMGEMQAVAFEATEGTEPLKRAKRLAGPDLPPELSEADRVLLVSRFANDTDALQLAVLLQEKGIPFVSISSVPDQIETAALTDFADVHINLGLTKGLLPDESGNRFGFPTSMAALYVYYSIRFTIEEILEEYEEE